ncbi:MAG: SprT family zinc-dependent metalloprotease [Eubacteriales bacterium]|nr:SprT family zinc-dependent metalloprotease [Eubacteriales bacterium]
MAKKNRQTETRTLGRLPEGIPALSSIRIIRSDRRTLSLQVRRDGEVLVRAPRRASLAEIESFVRKNAGWLQKHIELVEKEREAAAASPVEPLSMEEIRKLADEALRVIPARVAHYAPLVGVRYGRITIRNQRTRWGSCSSKGNLNFNCLLMLAPPEVLDYVVVHELCHRKEMNHSPRFWAEVERVIPSYKTYEKWLKTEGSHLMRRMTG